MPFFPKLLFKRYGPIIINLKTLIYIQLYAYLVIITCLRSCADASPRFIGSTSTSNSVSANRKASKYLVLDSRGGGGGGIAFIHSTTRNSKSKYNINANANGPTISNSKRSTTQRTMIKEPDDDESNFGRQKYWNNFYEDEGEFTWYSPWNDIAPFFKELVPLPLEATATATTAAAAAPRILLPGIGNDSSMVDMYDDGYTHLTAFDYAEEGVECAKKFFGPRLLQTERQTMDDGTSTSTGTGTSTSTGSTGGVHLSVADARDLPYESNSFDAVLEKGTLDAIYLSGGKDKNIASTHLTMAIDELSRVVVNGGIVVSITAACADAIEIAFTSRSDDWEMIRDGGFFMTEDGFASNNIDATLFAWQRKN